MSALRSFWAFDDAEDKYIRFLATPLLVVTAALGSVLTERRAPLPDESAALIGSVFMLYVQIAAVVFDVRYDQHRFGGTFTSKNSWLEYLKSSPRGKRFYNEVMRGSQIVRFLYFPAVALLYQLTRFLAGGVVMQPVSYALFYAASGYVASQLGSVITRLIAADYVAYFAAVLVSGAIVAMVNVLQLLGVMSQKAALWTVTGCAFLVGVLIGVVVTVIGAKKKEREYVDR